jgi:uncharacterized protein
MHPSHPSPASPVSDSAVQTANTVTQALPRGIPIGFFAVAFGFSWLFWLAPLATDRGWITVSWVATAKLPFLLGGAFGPFVASVAFSYWHGGRAGTRSFLGQALRFRIAPVQLVGALLLCPAIGAMAMALVAQDGGPPLSITLAPMGILGLFLTLFFIGGSLQEEFGWAYAIDRLQTTRRPLPSALILGVVWGLWHLPLFFISDITQFYMPFWTFVLSTVALRVFFVWAYNASNRSIFVTLLFHTSLNLSLSLYPLILRNQDGPGKTWYLFVALLCIASLPFMGLLSRFPGGPEATAPCIPAQL